MLKVSTKKKSDSLRLELGGKSALVLRKAESFDHIAAESEALRIVAAIDDGREALADYLLGDSGDGDVRDRGALLAIITEIEIAMRVVSGLENIEMDDVVQTQTSRSLFAAMFRETWILNAFRAKSRGDLHVRTEMGNGSESSPIGERQAASPIADPAIISGPHAPEESAAIPAVSVQNESMAI